MLVTFDDGMRSQFVTALPELLRVGILATFFIVMGALDADEPFWWEAVLARRKVLRGFSLGGRNFDDVDTLVTALKSVENGHRLEALTRLDAAYGPAPRVEHVGRADVRSALGAGHSVGDHSWTHPLLDKCNDAELREEMERSSAAFTTEFPEQPLIYAYPNGNLDDRVVSYLRGGSYRAGFLFDHRLAELDDPLRISRLRVNEKLSTNRFDTILSGLHSVFMQARGRLPR